MLCQISKFYLRVIISVYMFFLASTWYVRISVFQDRTNFPRIRAHASVEGWWKERVEISPPPLFFFFFLRRCIASGKVQRWDGGEERGENPTGGWQKLFREKSSKLTVQEKLNLSALSNLNSVYKVKTNTKVRNMVWLVVFFAKERSFVLTIDAHKLNKREVSTNYGSSLLAKINF